MTIKRVTEITCDKCGSGIDEHGPFWTARAMNSTAFPGYNPMSSRNGPREVAICLECVRAVLGELISNAWRNQ